MAISPIPAKNPRIARARAVSRIASSLSGFAEFLEERREKKRQREQETLDREAQRKKDEASAKQQDIENKQRDRDLDIRAMAAQGKGSGSATGGADLSGSKEGSLSLLALHYGGRDKIPADVLTSVDGIFQDQNNEGRNVNLRRLYEQVFQEKGEKLSALMERRRAAITDVFGEDGNGSGVLMVGANDIFRNLSAGDPDFQAKLLEEIDEIFFGEDGFYADLEKNLKPGLQRMVFDWMLENKYKIPAELNRPPDQVISPPFEEIPPPDVLPIPGLNKNEPIVGPGEGRGRQKF